jgi:hypothetical protein
VRIVHLKKDPYEVRIDRATVWGNPWSSKKNSVALYKTESRQESVDKYRAWLKGEEFKGVLQDKRKTILESLETLRGKTLGCWCHPAYPCHGEVLLELLGEDYENDPRREEPDASEDSFRELFFGD